MRETDCQTLFERLEPALTSNRNWAVHNTEAPRFIGRKMSGDEAPPRSPTPERADAPEGDRGGSPDRGRDRSRSPPPRGRDSRSRSRSRDPPRADDRGRSPGAYGGGGGGRKVGIAGRWNSRGFGTYIDASLTHGAPSLPNDARIRRLIGRTNRRALFRSATPSSDLERGRGERARSESAGVRGSRRSARASSTRTERPRATHRLFPRRFVSLSLPSHHRSLISHLRVYHSLNRNRL